MSFKQCLICFIVIQMLESKGNDCDPNKCVIPKHYKEMGCTPVSGKDHCCPSRFDCDSIFKQPPDQCYFQGKIYRNGENIPLNVTISSCAERCRCTSENDSVATIMCNPIECVEEVINRPEAHCVKQKTLDNCCAAKIICDKEEIERLPACYVEKGKYRLGEIIYPKAESCHECICSDGFDNVTIVGNRNCREFACGIGLHDSRSIHSGCIPIYYGSAKCCPIGWRCPEPMDKIEVSSARKDTDDDPNMNCMFGSLNLKVGDSLSSGNNCIQCQCSIPPMAFCIQAIDC